MPALQRPSSIPLASLVCLALALLHVLNGSIRISAPLAVGDTICVHYNNKKYYIDIVEAKPQNAISVIETDCEVGHPGLAVGGTV